ncbi:oligosaccharide repeat unit polymerase, partial [Oceanobacillus massiliensis]|uniref:oligosaccharide repeat unit polymerase n=1 Tax=Oceanobacillus massiliensis TaxID=1465765 RepID=UPI0030174DC0
MSRLPYQRRLYNRFWKLNKLDFFSPYLLIPSIIIIYFVSSIFDFYRFEYFNVRYNIFPVIVVGLASYYLAVYIADKGKWKLPNLSFGFMQGKTHYLLYLLGAIGFIAYIVMMVTGQIGIADESIRRQMDPKLKFLSSLLWFSSLILISNQLVKQPYIARRQLLFYGGLTILLMGMFVMIGYRTPLLIMIFTLIIIYHYRFKRIKISWLVGIMLILSIAFSMFGLYRFLTEDGSNDFNNRSGPEVELADQQKELNQLYKNKMNDVPYILRRINSESVTSHIVLSKIMEYTEREGYLKGDLHKGIFTTILPGEQVSPRMMVTNIVNSISIEDGKYITRPERTTVPTFFGQLYIDAGYIGVVLGFMIMGFLASMLY